VADNAQKIPVSTRLNQGALERAKNAIQVLGKSLPASVVKVVGPIVTVKFEVQSGFTLPNVTIPTIGNEYARAPLQVGCKGMVIPSDAYLGGMSGLGGGTANLTQQFNLTALVFAPIGNSGWVQVDANAYVIYGPNGVVLRDTASNTTFTLTPSGITIKGNVTIQGSLTATGGITAGQGTGDQVGLQSHRHGTGTAAAGTVAPTAGT
jgi:hypothetical protein